MLICHLFRFFCTIIPSSHTDLSKKKYQICYSRIFFFLFRWIHNTLYQAPFSPHTSTVISSILTRYFFLMCFAVLSHSLNQTKIIIWVSRERNKFLLFDALQDVDSRSICVRVSGSVTFLIIRALKIFERRTVSKYNWEVWTVHRCIVALQSSCVLFRNVMQFCFI